MSTLTNEEVENLSTPEQKKEMEEIALRNQVRLEKAKAFDTAIVNEVFKNESDLGQQFKLAGLENCQASKDENGIDFDKLDYKGKSFVTNVRNYDVDAKELETAEKDSSLKAERFVKYFFELITETPELISGDHRTQDEKERYFEDMTIKLAQKILAEYGSLKDIEKMSNIIIFVNSAIESIKRKFLNTVNGTFFQLFGGDMERLSIKEILAVGLKNKDKNLLK